MPGSPTCLNPAMSCIWLSRSVGWRTSLVPIRSGDLIRPVESMPTSRRRSWSSAIGALCSLRDAWSSALRDGSSAPLRMRSPRRSMTPCVIDGGIAASTTLASARRSPARASGKHPSYARGPARVFTALPRVHVVEHLAQARPSLVDDRFVLSPQRAQLLERVGLRSANPSIEPLVALLHVDPVASNDLREVDNLALLEPCAHRRRPLVRLKQLGRVEDYERRAAAAGLIAVNRSQDR